jgi:crotonobetainyl-CoA:carnitine CoA-transferase CaiB-like acyl-CoA transferase
VPKSSASTRSEAVPISTAGRCPSEGKSFYWEGLNKGKKSIAVDFSSPQGRKLVTDLVTAPGADAGILVTNYPKDGFLSHERTETAPSRPDHRACDGME